ncbi:MAG: DUF1826 domain-containing protein [Candidatus Caenarcaniphilales bacterium]|nr:DUF1826 domain-containing protein [Candidatus Caenarcaniphilales bacterium]
MSIFRTNSIEELKEFSERSDQLTILERSPVRGAEAFFEELMIKPFGFTGEVFGADAEKNVREILEEKFSSEIESNPFYDSWVLDMVKLCEAFCEMQNSDSISFKLGSQRGCRRYHVDFVPLRLLVTYGGKGTELLPDEAADRDAFENGEANEKIVKDSSVIEFMKPWEVAVFHGGPKGILHRTPDDALNGPSVMMRLDHSTFGSMK